jgi:hypothetical protein
MNEKIVRQEIKTKSYRDALRDFEREKVLSPQELDVKFKEYLKDKPQNVISKDLKSHTAFYFLKRLRGLMNTHGKIETPKKASEFFTPKDLEIINHFQFKTKFNDSSKTSDVMVCVSRLINEKYGSTFRQDTKKRSEYMEILHPHLKKSTKYESTLQARLEEVNITNVPCRSPLKDKIVSITPTENDLGNYYSRKENKSKKSDKTRNYDMKKDIHGNKPVTRKMNGTPYATNPMYRDAVQIGVEEHFMGFEPNKDEDKVDVPITREVATYEYKPRPKDKMDNIGVIEPTLNSKTKKLSHHKSEYDGRYIKAELDGKSDDKVIAKIPTHLTKKELDKPSAVKTNRNLIFGEGIKHSVEDKQYIKENGLENENCKVGDIIFVEYTPKRVEVFDKENYSLYHNQEFTVYYFIFKSYSVPITLYRAVVRNGLEIEYDYEVSDIYTDCEYIDYKLDTISRVSNQITPSVEVTMPYLLDGKLTDKIHYVNLHKSASHKLINNGNNRRYFKSKVNETIHNDMENETLLRCMLKIWRKRVSDKKPITKQKIIVKNKEPVIIEKPKPIVEEVVVKEEPQIDYHKIKKQQIKDSKKDWINGIQFHMKPTEIVA